MSANFEIIVGTYEQFLLGYKVQRVNNEYTLERSFATHSHQASIRDVASKKHYLASTGADDSVYLYDMRYRLESGRLTHHNDTVNCIEFTPEASHLFTCSNDGSIAAVHCGNWQLEKHWRTAHKGSPVNVLAIHPTGKIALSAGGDGVLRTWNLVKGRQAYATNLVPRLKEDAKHISILKWSPDGDKYLLGGNFRIDVYSVTTAGIVNELKFDSKVVCVEFLEDGIIAIGHEDGKIRFYDIDESAEILVKDAHDARVKCIAREGHFLVTGSSSGEIKFWKFTKKKLVFLQKANCGARITCFALALPCEDLSVKKEESTIDVEVEKKKVNKFRMRQEVIIEDEGETPENIKVVQIPKMKKKVKRKMSIDETSEVPNESNNIVSKKKKKNKNKAESTMDISVETIKQKQKQKKKANKFVITDNNTATLKKKTKNEFNVEECNEVPLKRHKKKLIT
ncbi:p21-activated protein kinase-interacting protein 1-like [Cephus cinctus]|uniref:P21-activated protein kinase-interacting protein 1-like n=1 Tax=Cephus cinctus TaxID=211228 RepID=A0AAJ7RAB1_CEPCN|nr:p21-activated protein kinase-interacting protein 1-like [Cephus cinctus]